MVGFYFIPGVSNPADILSKHWDILKFGQYSWHYYSGWETQMTFMIEELPHFE
jgi:hypothetical protein